MSLAAAITQGAIHGSICGGSLGSAVSLIQEDPKEALKGAVIGAVYGVALAAIAHFGGVAAVIGATVGAAAMTTNLLFAASIWEGDLRANAITLLFMAGGSLVGYGVGALL